MSITIPPTWTQVPDRGVTQARTGLLVRSQEWRVLELAAQHLAGVRLPQHAASLQRYRIDTSATEWKRRLACPPYAYQLLVWHSSVADSPGASIEVTLTVSTATTAGVAIDSVTLDPYVQGDEPVTIDAVLEWADPAAATSLAEVDVTLSTVASTIDSVMAITVAWGCVALPLTPPWGSGTL